MDFTKAKNKVLKAAELISKNSYLKTISEALTTTMPVIMLGSFALLLSTLNIPAYQNFIESIGIKKLIEIPADVLIPLLSIYVVFFIAYKLVNNMKPDMDSAGAGLISLMAFFIVTPTITVDETDGFTFEFLGAQGLFVAIIVGLIVGRMFIWVVEQGWTIKMPKGVPPTVYKTFASLIPGAIIISLFSLISFFAQMTPYESIHQMIYTLIQAPLQNLGSTYWSMIAFIFTVQILWFFGIHGFMVVSPIFYSVWLPLGLENLEMIARGEEQTNILSGGFYNSFVVIGGSGATIGLAILLLFFSKSKRYKTLGKISLPPAIFGINEPIIFGTPMVLNPFMFVPFVFGPIIISSFAYWTMRLGLFPIANGTHFPAGTPLGLNSFVNGGVSLLILQFLCVLLSVVIYYPFFRVIDKQSLKDEQDAEESSNHN